MALQSFIGIVLLNLDGSPAAGATATVYAKSDADMTTPLATKNVDGSPVSLVAGPFGKLPDFYVDTTEPAIRVKGPTGDAALVMSIEAFLGFVPGVVTVNGRNGAVVLTKEDVGLDKVDNTPDASKPVSGPTATALAGKAALGHTHALTDVTGLTTALAGKLGTSDALDPANLSGVVPVAKLGTGFADSSKVLYGDGTWKAAPTGGGGSTDGAVFQVNGKNGPTVTLVPSDIGALPSSYTPPVTQVAGKTGAVTLVKADVGLDLVDNTPDASKPVSGPTATALAGKANAADVVALTGNQTIAGVKSFTNPPVVPDDAFVQTKVAGLVAALADKIGLDDAEAIIEPIVAEQASELGDAAVARTVYGSQNGEIIKPWGTPQKVGPQLWALNLLSPNGQTSTLAPTLTAAGSETRLNTFVRLLDFTPTDAFRIEFDWAYTGTNSGWWDINLAVTDASLDEILPPQVVAGYNSGVTSGHASHDFQIGGGFNFFRLQVHAWNNVPSGAKIAITNVSLRRLTSLRPPLLLGKGAAAGDGGINIWSRLTNGRGTERTSRVGMGATINSVDGFEGWSPFRFPPPSPHFDDEDGADETGNAVNGDEVKTDLPRFQLNIGNNDQILQVKKSDGSFELRGNVHGGEALASGNPTVSFDRGDGIWVNWADLTRKHLESCRRVKYVWNTTLTRTGDSTPFANVAHTTTFFDDGTMRTDRTTTFLAQTTVGMLFEWMSSHPTDALWLGRIGKGQTVLGDADTHTRLDTPDAPTATPSSSGGTLTGKRYYRVSALSAGGETLASEVVAVGTSGTTASVALSWAAVAGAVGYRVYGGGAGAAGTSVQTALLAEVTSGTTWTDTGAAVPHGLPPTENTARVAGHDYALEAVGDATWSVWYDPYADLAYANIFDRDAVLNRPGVAGVYTRIQSGSGIMKQYMNIFWDPATGDDTWHPGSGDVAAYGNTIVAAGTVWSATHWSTLYTPTDPAAFHAEVANKAANLGALKTMYPVD